MVFLAMSNSNNPMFLFLLFDDLEEIIQTMYVIDDNFLLYRVSLEPREIFSSGNSKNIEYMKNNYGKTQPLYFPVIQKDNPDMAPCLLRVSVDKFNIL